MTSDVSAQPDDGIYIHKIRVSWADCDPANIAYTGRLPNFALDAINSWWLVHFGEDWYRLNLERDFATPFVHLEMDLRKPVTPLHPLLIALRLAKLGTSSFTFAFVARQNNEVCSRGGLSASRRRHRRSILFQFRIMCVRASGTWKDPTEAGAARLPAARHYV